jgi:RNA polymerase sigma-70 factor (ECF subfamily)
MTLPKTGYSAMDDARLAQQARTDPQAFAELYRRHVRSIYRYHLAHTGNVKDAEGLTSQTFMAALEGIRSFRGSGPYITWLIGIASRKRAFFPREKASGPIGGGSSHPCFWPTHRQSRGAASPNGSAF